MPETWAVPCPGRLKGAVTASAAVAGRLTAEVRAGQMAWVAAVPSWKFEELLMGEGWACAWELQLP